MSRVFGYSILALICSKSAPIEVCREGVSLGMGTGVENGAGEAVMGCA